MSDDKAQLMHDMAEQLQEALEVLHFDESSEIIALHIEGMLQHGGDDSLQKIVDAIIEYQEKRRSATIPGYDSVKNK